MRVQRDLARIGAVLLAGLLLAVCGCGGKAEPKLLPGTTPTGLQSLPPELATKVICATEEMPSECAEASTGTEHCKYTLRRNAERQLLEDLQNFTTISQNYTRDTEALETAVRIVDTYLQETTVDVQLSYHESNMFHQVRSDREVYLLRVCVLRDEALGYLLRSTMDKARATDREEIARYAESLIDSWFDGKPPARRQLDATTKELYGHFNALYDVASRQLGKR